MMAATSIKVAMEMAPTLVDATGAVATELARSLAAKAGAAKAGAAKAKIAAALAAASGGYGNGDGTDAGKHGVRKKPSSRGSNL